MLVSCHEYFTCSWCSHPPIWCQAGVANGRGGNKLSLELLLVVWVEARSRFCTDTQQIEGGGGGGGGSGHA